MKDDFFMKDFPISFFMENKILENRISLYSFIEFIMQIRRKKFSNVFDGLYCCLFDTIVKLVNFTVRNSVIKNTFFRNIIYSKTRRLLFYNDEFNFFDLAEKFYKESQQQRKQKFKFCNTSLTEEE